MVSKDAIIDAVCEVMEISREDLLGRSRKQKFVRPRQIAMWLMKEEGSTNGAIALRFGRDKQTVIYSRRLVDGLMQDDHWARKQIELIRFKYSPLSTLGV